MGTVEESSRPVRLVTTWGAPEDSNEGVPSRVTFEIEPFGDIVRLTVTHEDIPTLADREIAAHGWAAVLSNLKTRLETGRALPQRPWEMPVGTASAFA